MNRHLIPLACIICAFALPACGFRPIYATPVEGADAALNQLIAVRQVAAPQTVRPLIVSALNNRIVLKEGEIPKYDLDVVATERAERLAVQIDATVTRYNYRLRANYTLTDLDTGARATGEAQAVTSYNIVSSQYSTLFAERAAQEKAATLLAEEIERDLLVRFSSGGVEFKTTPIELDADTEILQEPDWGEVIDTHRNE